MTVAVSPTVLHLGCGRQALRDVNRWARVIALDADARLEPDIVCTLGRDPIPLDDDSVDVAVAQHVLEHIGRQGETAAWFAFWEELYRVLRPGGLLRFESPLASSTWAWADPSHTRALSPESFVFLDQEAYRQSGSSISPFRIRCDFELFGICHFIADVNPAVRAKEPFSHFSGVLRARKPLRPWWESPIRCPRCSRACGNTVDYERRITARCQFCGYTEGAGGLDLPQRITCVHPEDISNV